MKEKPNFLEIETVEEANNVNLDEYSSMGFSASRDRYIFKKRSKKA